MAWVVGVEVPDELAERDLRLVDGEGNNLQEDGLHELRWPLMNPLGPVTVRWSDAASMEAERSFNASDHRIFKVAKSGAYGRCVVRVTHGNYVVIAPQALSRDENVGGPAPVAPEDVVPEQAKVLAHHLLVEGEREVLVLDGGGPSRVEVRPSTATAYELIGNIIEDAHTEAGPLFGREPPCLRVKGAEEPSLFVVGVEGPSPGPRPRKAAVNFDELRGWLDDNQPGWFYVRTYNANDELLESLDFRYVKGLEAIDVDGLSPIPGPEGHRPATVVFRVTPGTMVSAVDGSPETISLDPARAERFVIPARPDAGRATWRLRVRTRRGVEKGVEVVVHVPRIWWAITLEGDGDYPDWTDRAQTLSPDYFLATSSYQLSVLLPEPGWSNAIFVGFKGDNLRQVRVPSTERRVDLPLRNVGQGHELRCRRNCDLLLFLETPTTSYGPASVGVFTCADLPPEAEDVFLILGVEDGLGVRCEIETHYLVTILGKIVGQGLPSGAESPDVLVKTINEGWFLGRIEVAGLSGVEDDVSSHILKSNPVKCEYSSSDDCITAIEDRHGDGGMYCPTCRRLFWDAQRLKDEERKGHTLHGPITRYFIRWDLSGASTGQEEVGQA